MAGHPSRLLFVFLLGLGLSFAAPRGQADLMTYVLGNSLTAPLHALNRLESLTQGEAPNAVDLYRQVRGSTALTTFAETPYVPGKDFADPLGTYDVAFANNKLDIITLQPFYGPTIRQEAAAASQIVQLLRQNPMNANTRVLILATWPQLIVGQSYQQQWNTSGFTLDSAFVPSAQAYELFMSELRLTFPTAEIIPVGHVYNAIAEATLQPGGVPGISSVTTDLYGDPIHPNNAGAYVESLTAYSVIYGKSPVGLPYTSSFSNPLWGTLLDPAAVTPVQVITWQATQPFLAVPEGNALVGVGAAMWMIVRRRRGSA
jgi:hypothetical protein